MAMWRQTAPGAAAPGWHGAGTARSAGPFRRVGLVLVLALAVATAGGPAPGALAQTAGAVSDGFLPAGSDCPACAALVVETRDGAAQSAASAGASAVASAGAVADALTRRGFRVTRLQNPPAYRLLHHVDRLFRVEGAVPGARLVLWYSGPVETGAETGAETGVETAAGSGARIGARIGDEGAMLPAAAPADPSAPAPEGVPGIGLEHLLGLAEASPAAAALVVLDADLPAGAARPQLASAPGDAAPARLLVLRADGTPAPLAPVLERLTGAGAALSLAAIAQGYAGVGEAGWPDAGAGTAATASRAAPQGGFGLLPSAGASDRIAVPGVEALVPAAIAAAPAAAPGAGALCDRLAAHPEAAETRGAGLADGRIDARAAAEACLAALLAEPGAVRFAYQYARALAAGGDAARAAAVLEGASALGHAPADFALGMALLAGEGATRDQRRGLGLVERAAEAGFGPAVRRYAEIAAIEDGRFADPARARRLLARAAEAGDGQAAYLLGEAVERGAGGSAEALGEARALYAMAAERGVAAARAAEARVAAAIEDMTVGAAVRACDRLLGFDVMAIESFVDLPPEVSDRDAIARVFARVDAMLDATDWRRALETCEAVATEDAAPPALVSRLAYLLWRAGRRGGPDSLGTDPAWSWLDLVNRAANAGDPVALYLRGWARMIRASTLLREGRADEAGRYAQSAEESFRAAAEAGVGQAGFLGARMHLSTGWADLPGFRQDPQAALAMLERIQPEAPRARGLLIEVYEGAPDYRHLAGLRDRDRARALKLQ